MPHGTKIATCCFCGTRAALVLTGTTNHELACSSCGAPLHNLKMMPSDSASGHRSRSGASGAPRGGRNSTTVSDEQWERSKVDRRRKKKKRKSLGKRFFEEAFDVLEDIFD